MQLRRRARRCPNFVTDYIRHFYVPTINSCFAVTITFIESNYNQNRVHSLRYISTF